MPLPSATHEMTTKTAVAQVDTMTSLVEIRALLEMRDHTDGLPARIEQGQTREQESQTREICRRLYAERACNP
jgi:capsule polysaccharide export protein KpsC/LpsZ